MSNHRDNNAPDGLWMEAFGAYVSFEELEEELRAVKAVRDDLDGAPTVLVGDSANPRNEAG